MTATPRVREDRILTVCVCWQWSSIAGTFPRGTISMCSGAAYSVRLEYSNYEGTSSASLSWETNGVFGNIVQRCVSCVLHQNLLCNVSVCFLRVLR